MEFLPNDMFGAPPLWHNGPSPGKFYNFPGQASSTSPSNIIVHSQTPITTGSSVLGVKFDKGVIIAADTLGAYGSLARFRSIERTLKVNENIILGAGGDYGDYQYLKDIIQQKIIDEECLDDGFRLKPKALHCWLTRVLYNRRSKFDPFWNNFVIGGLEDGVPFLGAVDKLGMSYVDDVIATGFGAYLATPLLRKAVSENADRPLSKSEALKKIHHCMEVLFYRDTRAHPIFDINIISADGIETQQTRVEENWQLAHMIKGYA